LRSSADGGVGPPDPSRSFGTLLDQAGDAPPAASAANSPAPAASPSPNLNTGATAQSTPASSAAARDAHSPASAAGEAKPASPGNAPAPNNAIKNGQGIGEAQRASPTAARQSGGTGKPDQAVSLPVATPANNAGDGEPPAAGGTDALDGAAQELAVNSSAPTVPGGKSSGKRDHQPVDAAASDSAPAIGGNTAPAPPPPASPAPPAAVGVSVPAASAATPGAGEEGGAVDSVAGEAAPLAALDAAAKMLPRAANAGTSPPAASASGTVPAQDSKPGEGSGSTEARSGNSPPAPPSLQDLVQTQVGGEPRPSAPNQPPSAPTNPMTRGVPGTQPHFGIAPQMQAGSSPAPPAGPIGAPPPAGLASGASPDASNAGDSSTSAPAQQIPSSDSPPPDAGATVTAQAVAASASPSAPIAASAPAAAAAPAAPAAVALTPIAGLAVEIAARAQAGSSRFDIRLDPPELGRIDVRLTLDRDGKVTSHLIAERSETLAVLQRDAPELQRSLQQAGLNTADDGLQFSLRDQGFGQQTPYPQQQGSQPGAARIVVSDPELPAVAAAASGYERLAGGRSGVDIRV
jgi:flagellar hook-length control protein FliK